jgi:magnesium-transporting ATPase (P-type)
MLTILPIAYLLVLLTYLFPRLSGAITSPEQDLQQFDAVFRTLLWLHLIAMALVATLLATYLRYLFKTEQVPREKKALWAGILLLGTFVAMPIFWYLYVWGAPSRTIEQGSPRQ